MKKFLSLVLALVMATSLLTFAAPTAGAAASFTDGNDIQYKEAVDVINAIAIMDGYGNGTFGPKATLTRGAASKIICNMILGPTTASALPMNVNPFPDVPSGSTFAGYIAYCVDQGIISGYADGTFRPADSLSGYAFLKMLLGALGYDQNREGYVGANWRVNVAKQALGIKLDRDLSGELDGARTVTREEAALYAFNTLKADMVEYDTGNVLIINGDTYSAATVGTFHTKTWATSSTGYKHIDSHEANGLDIIQFGEYYFERLQRRTVNGDAFGRPATRWDWKGVEIGTYAETAKKVYYGGVKANEIYSDLNLPGDDSAEMYVNGVYLRNVDVKRSNDTDLNDYTKTLNSNGLIGDGTITEVFLDDDYNDVTICTISVYPGKISSTHSATSKKDAYVVVEGFSRASGAGTVPANFTRDGRNEFETTAFNEDDVVAFTFSDKNGEIKDMYRLNSVEGAVSRRNVGKSVSLDGTTYNYAKNYAFDSGIDEDSLTNNSEFVVYRDSQGYVLWIESAEFAVNQYALMTYIETHKNGLIYTNYNPTGGTDGNRLNDDRAHLIFADGVERNVYLDKAYLNNSNQLISDFRFADGDAIIVRYQVNDDGDYKLYAVEKQIEPSVGAFRISNKVSSGLGVTTDSTTIFVIQRGDDYRVYTGVRNAPNVSGDNTHAIAYYTGTGTGRVAKLVYVYNAASVNPVSKEITFLSGKSASARYTADDDVDYREYQAVVGDEIKTLYVRWNSTLTSTAASSRDDGNVPSLVISSDNIDDASHGILLRDTTVDTEAYDYDMIEAGSFDHATLNAYRYQGVKRTNNSDEIRVNTHDDGDGFVVTLAKDVHVYFVNDDGDISVGSVPSITTEPEYWVYFVTDDGDVTYLFICEYEDKVQSNVRTLDALSYRIGDEDAVAVPGFSRNGTIYEVELPASTSKTAQIALIPTVTDVAASITSNPGVTLEDGEGSASVTVTAENGDTRTYTVNFTVAE